MEVLAIVILVVAATAGLVRLARDTGPAKRRNGELHQLATAKHLTSGKFPTTCHWCRETALAKHVFLLGREAGAWHSIDLASRIAGLAPAAASDEARLLLVESSAQHKRLCSQKCVRDFLQSEGASPHAIDFKACAYCGASNLATAADCQHCGARQAA
jgi:hypothetical protein